MPTYRSFGFLLFSLVLLQNSISAQNKQTGVPGIIDLKKTIDIALANYPLIKAKEAQKEASQQAFKSAKTGYLPELVTQNQIQYSTSNGLNGSFIPNDGYAIPTAGGIRADNLYTPVYGSFSTLSLNWKFFDFGKVKNNVAYSKSIYEKNDAEYQEELFKHEIKVTDAYLLFLTYQKLADVQGKNYQRALELSRAIRSYTQSGLRPGVDSSFANAETSKAHLELLEAQLKAKEQKIALAELMGNDNINFEVDTMSFLVSEPVIDTISNFNPKNHPFLLPLEKSINANQFLAKKTMSNYYPSFTLRTVGWARGSGISNTNASQFDQNFADGVNYKAYNYMIAGTFIFNIMDLPKVRRDYKSELFHVEERRQLYNEQELSLKAEYQRAQSNLDFYMEQAKEAPIQLNAAKTAYLQSKARYESGLSTLPELTQNYYLLNRSEVDLSVARNNVWRGLLIKSAAAGDISLFLNAVKTN